MATIPTTAAAATTTTMFVAVWDPFKVKMNGFLKFELTGDIQNSSSNNQTQQEDIKHVQ